MASHPSLDASACAPADTPSSIGGLPAPAGSPPPAVVLGASADSTPTSLPESLRMSLSSVAPLAGHSPPLVSPAGSSAPPRCSWQVSSMEGIASVASGSLSAAAGSHSLPGVSDQAASIQAHDASFSRACASGGPADCSGGSSSSSSSSSGGGNRPSGVDEPTSSSLSVQSPSTSLLGASQGLPSGARLKRKLEPEILAAAASSGPAASSESAAAAGHERVTQRQKTDHGSHTAPADSPSPMTGHSQPVGPQVQRGEVKRLRQEFNFEDDLNKLLNSNRRIIVDIGVYGWHLRGRRSSSTDYSHDLEEMFNVRPSYTRIAELTVKVDLRGQDSDFVQSGLCWPKLADIRVFLGRHLTVKLHLIFLLAAGSEMPPEGTGRSRPSYETLVAEWGTARFDWSTEITPARSHSAASC